MKNRRSRPAIPAESATVAGISLPPELVDIDPIPEAKFKQIVQSAEQGDLTESDLDLAITERRRVTSKRKNAVIVGKPGKQRARAVVSKK